MYSVKLVGIVQAHMGATSRWDLVTAYLCVHFLSMLQYGNDVSHYFDTHVRQNLLQRREGWRLTSYQSLISVPVHVRMWYQRYIYKHSL